MQKRDGLATALGSVPLRLRVPFALLDGDGVKDLSGVEQRSYVREIEGIPVLF